MPENPPRGMPRITPYLLYEDATAAVDWLTQTFGFEEKVRFEDEGAVTHAELRLQGGVVYLGRPGGNYRSPKNLGQATQQVHVYIDHVDAHYERSKAAGATIIAEPKEQPYGDRRYDAEDLEGVRWTFAEHIRDVPADEWGATEA
jgi:PhnB protein